MVFGSYPKSYRPTFSSWLNFPLSSYAKSPWAKISIQSFNKSLHTAQLWCITRPTSRIMSVPKSLQAHMYHLVKEDEVRLWMEFVRGQVGMLCCVESK